MKRILSLGNNKYLHIDSYNENHETRGGELIANTFVTLMVLFIAGATACAMVGIDITNPQSTTIQKSK